MSKQIAQQYPDVGTVRAQAKKDWERDFKRAITTEQKIGHTMPWWLIIVAVCFFALSAPHTYAIFNRLTPGWGLAGPFAVEFGLLYVAFRRQQLQEKEKLTAITKLLWWLLGATSVIVNGAGSLMAVVSTTRDIDGLSFGAIINQFTELPAASQAGLILVPIAAIIIPAGTVVAGEGVAALIRQRQQRGNERATQWHEEQARVEFIALRDAAIAEGLTPKRAIRWATDITGYVMPTDIPVVDRSGQIPDENRARVTDSFGRRKPRRAGKNMNAREDVAAYIEDNPDAVHLSVRELAELAGVGKTIAAEVKNAYLGRNGHSEE